MYHPSLPCLVPVLRGHSINKSDTKASASFAEVNVLGVQRCCNWLIFTRNFAVPFLNAALPCDFCHKKQKKTEIKLISVNVISMMFAHSSLNV